MCRTLLKDPFTHLCFLYSRNGILKNIEYGILRTSNRATVQSSNIIHTVCTTLQFKTDFLPSFRSYSEVTLFIRYCQYLFVYHNFGTIRILKLQAYSLARVFSHMETKAFLPCFWASDNTTLKRFILSFSLCF